MATLSSRVAERATLLAHASNSFFPVVWDVPDTLYKSNFLALILGFEALHCKILWTSVCSLCSNIVSSTNAWVKGVLFIFKWSLATGTESEQPHTDKIHYCLWSVEAIVIVGHYLWSKLKSEIIANWGSCSLVSWGDGPNLRSSIKFYMISPGAQNILWKDINWYISIEGHLRTTYAVSG